MTFTDLVLYAATMVGFVGMVAGLIRIFRFEGILDRALVSAMDASARVPASGLLARAQATTQPTPGSSTYTLRGTFYDQHKGRLSFTDWLAHEADTCWPNLHGIMTFRHDTLSADQMRRIRNDWERAYFENGARPPMMIYSPINPVRIEPGGSFTFTETITMT